jgi:hypothetical protein
LLGLICWEANYTAGTVDQMLNGKEFNRATRAFVLAYEALSVSWLSAFFSWCNDNFWSDLSELAVTFPLFRIEYFATLFQWH